MNRLLVDFHAAFVQGVKYDGRMILEYFAISNDSTLGNVFAGRVENVRGNQCFVSFSKSNRNGILTTNKNKSYKVGDRVLCQVAREEYKDKGAILTEDITLAGRGVILSKNVRKKLYSRKLTMTDKSDLSSYSLGNCIVRSEIMNMTQEEAEEEFERLNCTLNDIYDNRYDYGLIYAEGIGERLIKEFSIADTEIISNRQINCSENISVYDGVLPIFDYYGIKDKVEELFARKIETKGVELVFDETEAMTVIDVNANSTIGASNFEINKIAAAEIARQIQLRNYGGIILVDFVNMAEDMASLSEVFQSLLNNDKEKCKLDTVNDLFIIAINRKKRYNNFKYLFYTVCARCGEGREKRYSRAVREIARLYSANVFSHINVRLNPRFEKAFLEDYAFSLRDKLGRAKVFLLLDATVEDCVLDLGDKLSGAYEI